MHCCLHVFINLAWDGARTHAQEYNRIANRYVARQFDSEHSASRMTKIDADRLLLFECGQVSLQSMYVLEYIQHSIADGQRSDGMPIIIHITQIRMD